MTEIDPNAVPIVDPPPDPDPPPPEPEPLPPDPDKFDERGVSWRNVAAENQRKLLEAGERERQYQQRLGAQYQQQIPSPAPVGDELEALITQFDPAVQKALRGFAQVMEGRAEKKARTVGLDMITQITHQQEVQNPEMLQEARNQRAILDNNPIWAGTTETQRNELAIANAKVVMASKKPAPPARPANGAPTGPPAQAPPTRGVAPVAANNREAFIQKWVTDPNNLGPIRKMFGKKFDPDDPKIKKMLRASAEEILDKGETSMWGGSVKSALDSIVSQAESQRSRE
jgi:hypothetical protein